jgi:hypothetical protein
LKGSFNSSGALLLDVLTVYDGTVEDTSGTRWLDFVFIDASTVTASNKPASGYYVYQCLQTHTLNANTDKSSGGLLDTSVTINSQSVWKAIDTAGSLYVPNILAKNGSFELAQGGELLAVSADGKLQAGLLTNSSDKDDIRFFAGEDLDKSDLTKAPTYITKSGILHASGAVIKGEFTSTTTGNTIDKDIEDARKKAQADAEATAQAALTSDSRIIASKSWIDTNGDNVIGGASWVNKNGETVKTNSDWVTNNGSTIKDNSDWLGDNKDTIEANTKFRTDNADNMTWISQNKDSINIAAGAFEKVPGSSTDYKLKATYTAGLMINPTAAGLYAWSESAGSTKIATYANGVVQFKGKTFEWLNSAGDKIVTYDDNGNAVFKGKLNAAELQGVTGYFKSIYSSAKRSDKTTPMFKIGEDGKIVAIDVDLTGKITANDGSITNLDANKIRSTGFNSNGERLFELDENGALTVHDAKVYGSIYADGGYFSGKLQGSEGYFKSIQSEESFRDSDGVKTPYFRVTEAGWLTCYEALVNGEIQANNGYFKNGSFDNCELSNLYSKDKDYDGNRYFELNDHGMLTARSAQIEGEIEALTFMTKPTRTEILHSLLTKMVTCNVTREYSITLLL